MQKKCALGNLPLSSAHAIGTLHNFHFRLYLWKKKTDSAQVNSKPPELQSLPPTSEALALNIKKAHYQTVMWKTCLQRQPMNMDPCNV